MKSIYKLNSHDSVDILQSFVNNVIALIWISIALIWLTIFISNWNLMGAMEETDYYFSTSCTLNVRHLLYLWEEGWGVFISIYYVCFSFLVPFSLSLSLVSG